jgi:hypothetical protein
MAIYSLKVSNIFLQLRKKMREREVRMGDSLKMANWNSLETRLVLEKAGMGKPNTLPQSARGDSN